MANLDALQENSMSSRWAYCIPIKILQMIAEKNVYIIYIYLFIYLYMCVSVCMCVCLEKNYVNIRQLPSTNWFKVTPGFTKPQVFWTGNDHRS